MHDFNLLAHFRYPTHFAYVFQHELSGQIHCLKYNQRSIDWTYYAYEQWDQCKEYMIEALPLGVWGFTPDPD